MIHCLPKFYSLLVIRCNYKVYRAVTLTDPELIQPASSEVRLFTELPTTATSTQYNNTNHSHVYTIHNNIQLPTTSTQYNNNNYTELPTSATSTQYNNIQSSATSTQYNNIQSYQPQPSLHNTIYCQLVTVAYSLYTSSGSINSTAVTSACDQYSSIVTSPFGL